jgi:hypothetical protein
VFDYPIGLFWEGTNRTFPIDPRLHPRHHAPANDWHVKVGQDDAADPAGRLRMGRLPEA